MPLWARFLCAATCGGAAALAGLILGACWRQGYPEFWADLWRYGATVRFWDLTGRLWLLSAVALVLARVTRYGTRWSVLAAGMPGGTLVALAFAAYLTGRFHLALPAVTAEAALIASTFAGANVLAAWVYERL